MTASSTIRDRPKRTVDPAATLRRRGLAFIGLAVVGSTIVVVGTIVGTRRLAAPITGDQVVKLNAALAMAAVGVAVLVGGRRGWPRRAQLSLAAGVVALGATTVLQWCTGWSLGIDEALVADRWPQPDVAAGRPAPLIAVVLALLGLGLIAPGRSRVRDLLFVLATSLSIVMLTGHAFGVHAFVSIGETDTVPIEATVLVVLLSSGAIMAGSATRPLEALFDSSTLATTLARRAALLAVLIPLLGGLMFHAAVDVWHVDEATAAWLIAMAASATAFAAVLRGFAMIERLGGQLRTLMDSIPDGVYETDFHGRPLLANNPLARLFGYRNAAAFLAHVDDVRRLWVHPEHRAALVAEIESGRSSGTIDVEFFGRGRSRFVGELRFRTVVGADGRPRGLRGTIRDVTEARALEREVEEADERFRLAFETGPLGRAVIDLRVTPPRFAAVNGRLAAMLGYSQSELLDLPPTYFVPPDELDSELRLIDRSSADRDAPIEMDTHRRHRDGSWVPVHLSGGFVFANGDGPRYGIFSAEDLRPRLAAERELEHSRQMLKNFVENVPSAVYMLDREGRFLLVNQELERILGVPASEVLGRTRAEIAVFGSSGLEHRRNDVHVMETGAQTLEEWFGEGEATRCYLSTKFPLVDSADDVFGVGGVSTDITVLRRLEIEADRAWAQTTQRLATAIDYRDEETGAHVERMSAYCELIATHLGDPAVDPGRLRAAARLHDVGKIAIPDAILTKPDTLTAAERAVMERHTTVGFELLCGTGNADLELAATIAHTHHERWDGTGYPCRLKKLDIPIEGRIAAIADVFDALTSDRIYRRAFDVDTAVRIMTEGSGSAFDPDLLTLFLAHLDEAAAIRERRVVRGVSYAPTA